MAGSNLVAFLHAQRYKTDSHPALLQAPIKQVVDTSRRLTIVLFCDGQSEIIGTPYDQGINQTIHDTAGERKKSRQPFVVVLRTPVWKISPAARSIFRRPISVCLRFHHRRARCAARRGTPPVTNTPSPHPASGRPHSAGPSLIIVGTQVGTNPAAAAAISEPATNASASRQPDQCRLR